MIPQSKVRNGLLTIDGVSFATVARNVRLVPSTDEVGDEIEVLSGDLETPEERTSWALSISAVQDFDDPTGFQRFALTSEGEIVPYSWTPSPASPTFSGNVRVRAVEIGGAVGPRPDAVDAEWPCQEKPTVTPPAP